MALKLYLLLTGAIFLLVAVFHLMRLLNDWQVAAGPHTVPFALSYVGLPVSAGYSLWAAWLLRSRRDRAM